MRNKNVDFGVFTAVTMTNAVFWDVAPCGFTINRRFGGTCRFHLQRRRNNGATSQKTAFFRKKYENVPSLK
jgi:hypothetical protein